MEPGTTGKHAVRSEGEIKAKTAVTASQAVWDCRWARLAYPINRDTEHWVCVRNGVRRAVHAHDCETCPHWEMKTGEHAELRAQVEAATRVAC